MTEREKLAACPFCGSDAQLIHGRDGYFVRCEYCQLNYPSITLNTAEKAEAVWNDRSPPIPDGRIVREALDVIAELEDTEDADVVFLLTELQIHRPSAAQCKVIKSFRKQIIQAAALQAAALALPDQRVSGWQEALKKIAAQKTCGELADEGDGLEEEADFVGAYDTLILIARRALSLPLPPERVSEVLRTTGAPADATGEQ